MTWTSKGTPTMFRRDVEAEVPRTDPTLQAPHLDGLAMVYQQLKHYWLCTGCLEY
jgi:hypothetical protein